MCIPVAINCGVGELTESAMEIGQKVKVQGVIDRSMPGKMVRQLQQNPVGTIVGYKMVDRSEVGFVVKFDEELSTWFFEEELEQVN